MIDDRSVLDCWMLDAVAAFEQSSTLWYARIGHRLVQVGAWWLVATLNHMGANRLNLDLERQPD